MRHAVPVWVCVVILSVAGCGKGAKPTQSLSNVEPAFKLTAEEFHRQANDQKFQGKVIELSGTVEDINRNASGEAFVQLKAADSLLGVMCFTEAEEPWTIVARGQKVRIKGLYGDTILAPRLLSCVFVETGEYMGVKMTAEALAKEYAADEDATLKKYDKKHLVITGEIVKKEANELRAVTVTLKTGNAIEVKCAFTGFDFEYTQAYTVGQTVTIFGDFSLNFGGESVTLLFCQPVAPK